MSTGCCAQGQGAFFPVTSLHNCRRSGVVGLPETLPHAPVGQVVVLKSPREKWDEIASVGLSGIDRLRLARTSICNLAVIFGGIRTPVIAMNAGDVPAGYSLQEQVPR